MTPGPWDLALTFGSAHARSYRGSSRIAFARALAGRIFYTPSRAREASVP